MRPITGTDIITFYNSSRDFLVLTADGSFTHIDKSDITDQTEPTAYDCVDTEDGEVQILLDASTITDGEWFEDALDDNDDLIPSVADEMADIINNDGILPSRVLGAQEANRQWKQADAEADRLAAVRAHAVAKVVAFAGGNQSQAARFLGLDQSTVNKLVKKSRSRTVALVSAGPGDLVPGVELGDPDADTPEGLEERPEVVRFMESNDYDVDHPDELMYLVPGGDIDEIPDGFPTLIVRF
ncbi:hypothetical protein ACFV4E_22765 [Streptomyces hygroscopicus]|uniref:hypothetical protein n=1 Tax=Streptomyces hygroscopicus TaxID=1912 RepID=UPI0036922653